VSGEGYCRFLARSFWAPGYDREDMLQEARIAMWLAPPGIENLCARRRLIEIVRRSKRGGRPSFCEPVDAPDHADVVDLVDARERIRAVLSAPLTDLERAAIGSVVRGKPCTEKALDNALQRARRKLEQAAA
jgi:DNA-directed RNA polymerase specialized sigma24 family protein